MNENSATPRHLWQRIVMRRLKMIMAIGLLIAIGGGVLYVFAPQWLIGFDTWQKTRAAGLTTHHIEADDSTIAYYEGGDGPVMVLVHGYGSNRTIWLSLAKELTDQFHLIIPDMPGWGDSSRLADGDYHIQKQAERLHAFLRKKGLHRPLLVGHSLGGAIAGVYASTYPDDIGALVLMDSFGLTFDENAFARDALAGINPFIFDTRDEYRQTLALVANHPPDISGRFMDVFIRNNRADRDFLHKVFDLLVEPDQYAILDDRLADLTMPVLGVWCEDDKVIDISALDTLRNGLTHAPDISTSVIQDCGHTPQMEKPQALAQILAGYAMSH